MRTLGAPRPEKVNGQKTEKNSKWIAFNKDKRKKENNNKKTIEVAMLEKMRR
jgi:hypothetical protein